MVAACENPEPLTCSDLKELEADAAHRAFERGCNDDSITAVMHYFFRPWWATDGEDQRKALMNLLTRHELCRPTNHKGTECDPEEPCDDPVPTYCPDPEACPSKFYGYGLLEVIQAAIRADSQTYLPIKDLGEIAPGEPLVWDPQATPDNPNCDPCATPTLGAFVPEHLYTEPGGGSF